jgi:hypothetical protein
MVASSVWFLVSGMRGFQLFGTSKGGPGGAFDLEALPLESARSSGEGPLIEIRKGSARTAGIEHPAGASAQPRILSSCPSAAPSSMLLTA